MIYDSDLSIIHFRGIRRNNIYILSMNFVSNDHCLVASINNFLLWHKCFGHVNMKNISRILKLDLVNGLPKLVFKNDHFCDACQQDKMHKSTFKSK